MGFFKKKRSPAEQVSELLGAGRSQEALEVCREACRKANATAREWLLYGTLSRERGDLAVARTALLKAVELDGGLAAAHFALGQIHAAAGEYDAAIECLQKAAELQPDNADIWLSQGVVCGLHQQLPRAEACCRRAAELTPGRADAHFNLANALQGQGRLAEAEAEYAAALELAPDLATGWFMLAQARVGLRKFAAAKPAADRALALAPESGEAHFTMGKIVEALGEQEQARVHFHKATELLPSLPNAHMRLGQVLLRLGDVAAATRSFQKVIDLQPQSVKAHIRMGECFSRLELPEGALNCYRQAVKLNPDHLQAHYAIALLCGTLGRHAEAAKHLAEVLRLNPLDEQAKHLLAAHEGRTTATAPAAYVATLFDGVADIFDRKLVDELKYHAPESLHGMVNELAAPAPNSLDVIDLGCGTGLSAPFFRPLARMLHGVDLSPRMIEKAHERALYDKLEVGDILSGLAARSEAWDLAICLDVFVYLGDLHDTFVACAAALRPGGMFGFSVESGDDTENFVLRTSGRYAHASGYIRKLAAYAGLLEIGRRDIVVRQENGQDIHGYLFLLQRPAASTEG